MHLGHKTPSSVQNGIFRGNRRFPASTICAESLPSGARPGNISTKGHKETFKNRYYIHNTSFALSFSKIISNDWFEQKEYLFHTAFLNIFLLIVS